MHLLRHQMIEDLRLRGRADNTIDAYVRDVRELVEWAACRRPSSQPGMFAASWCT